MKPKTKIFLGLYSLFILSLVLVLEGVETFSALEIGFGLIAACGSMIFGIISIVYGE